MLQSMHQLPPWREVRAARMAEVPPQAPPEQQQVPVRPAVPPGPEQQRQAPEQQQVPVRPALPSGPEQQRQAPEQQQVPEQQQAPVAPQSLRR